MDAPDTFRGAHREDDPEAGPKYAQQVADTCEQIKNGTAGTGGGVAAFFIESGMSVAGVILPPTGYLKKCYEAVRAAGGVCVADEVQVGLGKRNFTRRLRNFTSTIQTRRSELNNI